MKLLTYKHLSKYIATVSLTVLIALPGKAQDTLRYSLEQVTQEVLTQNWDIRKLNSQLGMSKAASMQANSAFLPNVSVQENYMTTTDPMMAFGIKLRQESIGQADFDPTLLNDPDRIENFNTSVQVQMPIFNLDGIYGKKATQLNYEAVGHNKEWLSTQLTIHAKSLYYGLILSEERNEVVNQALAAAQADLKVAQGLYDQGIINDSDLMQAQIRVIQIESSVLQSQHDYTQLQHQLLHLMGRSAGAVVKPLEAIPALGLDSNTLTLAENRADLTAAKLQAESAALNHKSQKSGFIPRVNAYGTYDMHDTQILGNQGENYTVGVQLKWDLFQGGKKIGATQSAKYQSEYAQLQYEELQSNAEHELIQLQQSYLLAQKQLQLAKQSTEQAETLNRIIKDRYAQGLETTADLLRNESQYLSKQLQELQVTHEYLQLLFEIESKSNNETVAQ